MTGQLRNLPAEERGHAIVEAFYAIKPDTLTGARRAEVVYRTKYHGTKTERLYLVGIAHNRTQTSAGPAVLVAEYANVYQSCDYIPFTMLVAINPIPAGDPS